MRGSHVRCPPIDGRGIRLYPRGIALASILQGWSLPDRVLGSPRFVPEVREQGLRVSLRTAPGSTIPEAKHLSPPPLVGAGHVHQAGAGIAWSRSQHVVNASL